MSDTDPARPRRGWLPFLQSRSASDQSSATDDKADKEKWSMGILNDKKTIEVPGMFIESTTSPFLCLPHAVRTS